MKNLLLANRKLLINHFQTNLTLWESGTDHSLATANLKSEKLLTNSVFSQIFTRNAKNYLDLLFLNFCNFWHTTLVKGQESYYNQPSNLSSALVEHKGKVIETKYSKHWPYTVAHTFDCVCSKTNNSWFNPWFSFYFSSLYPAPYIEWYVC